jgi:hypothetical protein
MHVGCTEGFFLENKHIIVTKLFSYKAVLVAGNIKVLRSGWSLDIFAHFQDTKAELYLNVKYDAA